jgi:hypothetical protein
MVDKQMLQSNIIKLLGLESLPDERKIELLDKVTELVQKRILIRVAQPLSMEDRTKLLELAQGEKQEELNEFVAQKAPNMDMIIEEEVILVKQEMVSAVQ